MEVDFSSKIKDLFEAKAQQKQLIPNKEAVAKKIESILESKASEHNKLYSHKISAKELKTVYRRGLVAYASSHIIGQTRNSWGMARVNMFLKMIRGEEVNSAYANSDKDLLAGKQDYYEEKPEDCFWSFASIDFDLARIDLLKGSIDLESEGNIDLFDLDYSEAEKKTLNKPFRLPSGSNKKFGVYVKNDKGNVVMVKFGDPNMEIRRDDPERRKSFRARHQCDTNVGPRWKARYWSCKFWSKKPVSSMASEDFLLSDDDGMDWDWDDEGFFEQSELLGEWTYLQELQDFVEEEEL